MFTDRTKDVIKLCMHYAVRVFTCTCKTLNHAKVGTNYFLLVRKSQIRKFLGSFRNRKSANFFRSATPQFANSSIANLRKNILDYEMQCNRPPLTPSNKSIICYHEHLDVHEYEKQRKIRTSETPVPL